MNKPQKGEADYRIEVSDVLQDQVHAEKLAEYAALREEILQREEMRQDLLKFAILGAGAIFALSTADNGINSPWPLLIYPIIALFLALGWAQSDLRIGEIGSYIRENLEKPEAPVTETGFGWEQHLAQNSKTTIFRSVEATAIAIFVGTQILAMILAYTQLCSIDPISIPSATLSTPFLQAALIANTLAIVLTVVILRYRTLKIYRPLGRKPKPEIRAMGSIEQGQENVDRDAHWQEGNSPDTSQMYMEADSGIDRLDFALLMVLEAGIPLLIIGVFIFVLTLWWNPSATVCTYGFSVDQKWVATLGTIAFSAGLLLLACRFIVRSFPPRR